MTRSQIESRRQLCARCPRYLANPVCPQSQRLADSKAACPLDPPAWSTPGLVASLAQYQFGDAVAVIAQPIAQVVDAVAGTNLQNCGGCQQRQQAWNAGGVAQSALADSLESEKSGRLTP